MSMDPNAVSSSIRDFVAKTFLYSDQGFPYPDDASFLEEGVIDSLGIMEMVSFVEKQFGISVADAEILPGNFDSVEQLSRYVGGKMVHAS